MKLKILTLTLMIACIGIFAGCRKSVNNSNPAVVQAVALQDAENTCKTVEDGLLTANRAIEKLQATEPDYYNKVKPLLRKISKLNATASGKIALVASGQSADWKGALIAVSASVTPSDLTTFGFKNPNTQIIVETSFSGLILALSSIKTKFGGAQ